MRRKSERTASKKTKASPEKKDKPEKAKRPKTRRKKESSSSENESAEEINPVPPVVPETVPESNPPQTSAKEASPEETNEQVWQVKAAEGGEGGEIQKLKICLTRPPSTPERADRSPRSKRKHSRSASGEPAEERKKTKHRSKRSAADSKEEADTNQDSQGDEAECEKDQEVKISDQSLVSQKQEVTSNDTPMSTTTDESKTSEEQKTSESSTKNTNTTTEETSNQETKNDENKSESQEKPSDADTTVASPKPEAEVSQNSVQEQGEELDKNMCEEKSEVLEIHADESRHESTDIEMNDSQTADTKPESPEPSKGSNKNDTDQNEVSITGDKVDMNISSDNVNGTEDVEVTTNEQNVVEITKSPEKEISSILNNTEKENEGTQESNAEQPPTNNPTSICQEATVHNGQTTHSNRKRRWGSRPNRITTQKSITISTDILKDIIPDVKPAEFDEVIEEKKHHRRVEVTEKLERPVLPKIVIDNTESVEVNKKESDERDKENVKIRESNLSLNRKISIVKDNDSIIARPPSPPRHKQSNILFITNLVRPFTLPQLKNLLQRTGRIVESGFWIDRIKSKCFVQYETEDQAVETRHALHGVTWPVSNPKTLHVDFSTPDDFNKAKANEDTDSAQTSTIPGTVEDWLREQDLKRERGELEKPWERKMVMREWDVGKNEKAKEKDKINRDDRIQDKRRYRTPERSPEPAKKFKKKEEEAPAKLLDDLFRKTKATPCIYWLPLSAETIAVKEEQRRQHMAEHERRLQELRRTHRRH